MRDIIQLQEKLLSVSNASVVIPALNDIQQGQALLNLEGNTERSHYHFHEQPVLCEHRVDGYDSRLTSKAARYTSGLE